MPSHQQYIQLIQSACRSMPMRSANRRALKSTSHDFQSESLNGYCYDATEAAWFLFGRSSGLIPAKKGRGPTGHYWLYDASRPDSPIDIIRLPGEPSFDYSGFQIAYNLKNKQTPGIRAQKIINHVTKALGNVAA
jgi:hypothetical protein